VGKQRSTITNYLRLLKFEGDPDIKRGLVENRISMGHARALAGVEDYAMRNSLYKQIIESDLSVRAVEALIASYQDAKKPKDAKKEGSISPQMREIQDRLNAFFGAKVQLKREQNGKGQIVIKFANDSELNRVLDVIGN
jgi:ParB family chromosome partitioning protein